MKTEKRLINDLNKNPDNVRVHGSIQIKEFKRSIEQFGIIRPIVIDENNMILCGHGLYDALKEMGYTECDVIVKSGLTENQKKKLMLADNKIFSLGIDNFDNIDKILSELGGDFDIPGYNADDLESLYGASSISNEEKSFDIPKIEKQNIAPANNNDQDNINSSVENKNAAEVKFETNNYIICPHCGKRIELND